MSKKNKTPKTETVEYTPPNLNPSLLEDIDYIQIMNLSTKIEHLEKTVVHQAMEIARLTDEIAKIASDEAVSEVYRIHGVNPPSKDSL